jgi:hypothetical protein
MRQMILTELKSSEWQQFAAFIDTLCLPIYALDLKDKNVDQPQANVIERVTKRLEQYLKGRLLLLPAIPFSGQNPDIFLTYLVEVVKELSESSFHYLLLVVDEKHKEAVESLPEFSNLQVLTHVVKSIEALDQETVENSIEQEMLDLYNKTLNIWQTNK